ncbi:MAG: class I tRNA ligase family protein, partial [Lysobacterales bacterium]
YLDMIKDRIYTLPKKSLARRSAQTALAAALEVLVRALMPITPFTAAELWGYLPAPRPPSVWLATWAEIAPRFAGRVFGADEAALVAQLDELRSAVQKQIELLRNDGQLGGSLQAEVELYAPAGWLERLRPMAAELRFFFITSEVGLAALDQAPEAALALGQGNQAFRFLVRPTSHAKCIRCWQHRPDIGVVAEHPEICGRCVGNLDGEGETRDYF